MPPVVTKNSKKWFSLGFSTRWFNRMVRFLAVLTSTGSYYHTQTRILTKTCLSQKLCPKFDFDVFQNFILSKSSWIIGHNFRIEQDRFKIFVRCTSSDPNLSYKSRIRSIELHISEWLYRENWDFFNSIQQW